MSVITQPYRFVMSGGGGGGGSAPTQSIELNGTNQTLYMSSSNFGFANRDLWWFAVAVKRKSTGSAQDLVNKWGGSANRSFALYFNSSDQLVFSAQDSSNNVLASFTTFTAFASTSVFYHLYLSYDKAGGTLNLYSNGSEVSYGSRTQPNSGGNSIVASNADVGWGYPAAANWLNAILYQPTFGQGAKPNLSDIYASGQLKALVDVASTTSLLDVAGGVVTHDAVLASAWTNLNSATASGTVP
jgi:hypothetical protein